MPRIFSDINNKTRYTDEDIFSFVFYNSGFNEHYDITCINPNNNHVSTYRINPNNLYKELCTLNCTDEENVYITKNPLKTTIISKSERENLKTNIKTLSKGALFSTGANPKNKDKYVIARNNNNVYSLKNIVIDIDCHEDLSIEEFETIKNNFLNEYDSIFESLPEPTVVYFSGRGFHLWYNLESSYAKTLSWLYMDVTKKICDVLKKEITQRPFSFGQTLSVDYSSSQNICGLIRLFNTKNINSIIPSEICKFNKIRYTLDELKDKFKVDTCYTPITKSKQSTSTHKNNTSKGNPNNKKNKLYKNNIITLSKKRLEVFIHVAKRHPEDGLRDLICHFYYNFAVQIYSRNKAKKNLYKINRIFDNPLPDSKLINIMKTIDDLKLGHYLYKNETIIDRLNLNPEEIALLTTATPSQKAIRAQKKRENKKKNEEKILETYCLTDSIKEAAKIGHCCKNTVRNIIKKNKNNIDVIKRKIKTTQARLIFSNFSRTQSINKAAKSGKCSLEFAAYIIRRYQILAHWIEQCIADGTLVLDEFILAQKEKHYNKFYKLEYLKLEPVICNTLGLEPEDVNIAIAPYLRIDR